MINSFQSTVNGTIEMQGVGLHSGRMITMRLLSAAENTGIRFVRTDITHGDNVIPALWNYVVDTQLCTVIGNDNGATVGTIEHLMSALRGCSIDNVTIEIDGPEVPAMDGSAMPFVDAIEMVGAKKQAVPRRVIRVLNEVTVEEDGKKVTLRPDESCTFAGEIEFEHGEIGYQRFETQLVNGNFKHDIAEARTFGFKHEVEWMRSQGLALGGSLDNAIVLDTDKVLNPEGLRFSNEFIRHKLLDAIGDLYLAGGPILGLYDGVKAGHMMNNKVLHALFADDANWEYASYGSVSSAIEDSQTAAVNA
ncbi:MAG: UDP-3-O-acyl-N-acetylglucosamine deacetylase [Alphaproteobacteria bacterium]|nr:UDP-3-O-acyl-N-acetylglucosamine deacetylase [Alphaproteobacteria bacterium]